MAIVFFVIWSWTYLSFNTLSSVVILSFDVIVETFCRLAHYCGSVANSVSTKGEGSDPGNIMNVRFFAAKIAKEKSKFNATFTAYRTLNPSSDGKIIFNVLFSNLLTWTHNLVINGNSLLVIWNKSSASLL